MRDEDPLVAGWREGTRQLVVDAVTSLPALILASLGVPATVVSGMAGESSPLPSALVAQALTGIAVVLWLHRLDATSRAVAMSADGPVDAAAAKDLPSVDYTDVILTFLFAISSALRVPETRVRRQRCREAVRDTLADAASALILKRNDYCEVHLLTRSDADRLSSALHHRALSVPGEGLLAKVMRSGEAVRADLSDLDDVDSAALRSRRFSQLAAHPVVVDGRTGGVVVALARGKAPFGVSESRLVEVLAAQANVAWVDPLPVPPEGETIHVRRARSEEREETQS